MKNIRGFVSKIAERFKRYLESLEFDEIQVLNLDLAANGGGIQPIEKYSVASNYSKHLTYFIISTTGCHILLVYYQFHMVNFLPLSAVKRY